MNVSRTTGLGYHFFHGGDRFADLTGSGAPVAFSMSSLTIAASVSPWGIRSLATVTGVSTCPMSAGRGIAPRASYFLIRSQSPSVLTWITIGMLCSCTLSVGRIPPHAVQMFFSSDREMRTVCWLSFCRLRRVHTFRFFMGPSRMVNVSARCVPGFFLFFTSFDSVMIALYAPSGMLPNHV